MNLSVQNTVTYTVPDPPLQKRNYITKIYTICVVVKFIKNTMLQSNFKMTTTACPKAMQD